MEDTRRNGGYAKDTLRNGGYAEGPFAKGLKKTLPTSSSRRICQDAKADNPGGPGMDFLAALIVEQMQALF